MKTQFIPDGFHTVTPYLLTKNAAKVIEFVKRVFDGEEMSRMNHPDGSVMHAQVRIGDSIVMLFKIPRCARHLEQRQQGWRRCCTRRLATLGTIVQHRTGVNF